MFIQGGKTALKCCDVRVTTAEEERSLSLGFHRHMVHPCTLFPCGRLILPPGRSYSGSFRGDESCLFSPLLVVKRLLWVFLIGCWDLCTYSTLYILFICIIYVYIHTAVFLSSESPSLDADTRLGYGLILHQTVT